jgi:hypothetical protein
MAKMEFQLRCHIPDDELERHQEYAKSLNLPLPPAGTGKLAIAGGGGSLSGHIREVRSFPGAVWAINGAHQWCQDHGVEAIFVSASPGNQSGTCFLSGVRTAFLAETCSPGTIDAVAHASRFVFDADNNGPTSAVAATFLAVGLGYREIVYFGCEGNYGLATHAYQNMPIASDMTVRAGRADYRTNVGYFIQSQILAKIMREAPGLKNRSGGLLASLIADPEDWDVVELPEIMKNAERMKHGA